MLPSTSSVGKAQAPVVSSICCGRQGGFCLLNIHLATQYMFSTKKLAMKGILLYLRVAAINTHEIRMACQEVDYVRLKS